MIGKPFIKLCCSVGKDIKNFISLKGKTIMGDNINKMGLEKLITDIKSKKVIPVIGQGLYRVDIESENKSDILLYDYLAEQVLGKCKTTISQEENYKFAKACFQYLKEDPNLKEDPGPYKRLSDFLKETLKGVRLRPANSLWKLARIKNFDILINTAFDTLLEKTMKSPRSTSIKTLSYTKHEKYLYKLDYELFNSLKNVTCTLLYHILGNFENIKPAYTENNLQENMKAFHDDMLVNPQNEFFWKIRSRSLLFIQCGFDGCLLPIIKEIMTHKSGDSSSETYKKKLFIVDNFKNNSNELGQQLKLFSKEFGVEVFQTTDGSDFVDQLYEKIETECPEELNNPTAFISFEESDRTAAQLLVRNLRKDGIDVWWEENKLEGMGSEVEIVIRAVNKNPVYIPLISEHSKQFRTDQRKLKYRIREWERAYQNMITKKTKIIPVVIDKTAWKFDRFFKLPHIKIPEGKKEPEESEYKKLKDLLTSIQGKTRD